MQSKGFLREEVINHFRYSTYQSSESLVDPQGPVPHLRFDSNKAADDLILWTLFEPFNQSITL
jgi:hypothetical protein